MNEDKTIYKLKCPISDFDRFTLDILKEKFIEPVTTQEYPKMVYHDSEKPFTVNSKEEEDDATGKGYRLHPIDGSGSGRWPDASDWTHTDGQGLTADTNVAGDPPAVVIPEPTQYDADKKADELNADAS